MGKEKIMKIRIEIGDEIKLELPLLGQPGSRIARVTIVARGERIIQGIKEIRAFTGLGLKEAKDLSESWRPMFDKRTVADLDGFAQAIRAAGATIETEGELVSEGIDALVARILMAIGYLPTEVK